SPKPAKPLRNKKSVSFGIGFRKLVSFKRYRALEDIHELITRVVFIEFRISVGAPDSRPNSRFLALKIYMIATHRLPIYQLGSFKWNVFESLPALGAGIFKSDRVGHF